MFILEIVGGEVSAIGVHVCCTFGRVWLRRLVLSWCIITCGTIEYGQCEPYSPLGDRITFHSSWTNALCAYTSVESAPKAMTVNPMRNLVSCLEGALFAAFCFGLGFVAGIWPHSGGWWMVSFSVPHRTQMLDQNMDRNLVPHCGSRHVLAVLLGWSVGRPIPRGTHSCGLTDPYGCKPKNGGYVFITSIWEAVETWCGAVPVARRCLATIAVLKARLTSFLMLVVMSVWEVAGGRAGAVRCGACRGPMWADDAGRCPSRAPVSQQLPCREQVVQHSACQVGRMFERLVVGELVRCGAVNRCYDDAG